MILVFLLAALAAAFGWIMVASGLVNRPWVNAYKLSIHLGLALAVMGYLFRTFLKTSETPIQRIDLNFSAKWLYAFFTLILIQIFLGGMMSGMKAALLYPSWPDMNGELIPSIILDASFWKAESFINYDSSSFMSALVQLLHRLTAYIIAAVYVFLWMKIYRLRKELDPFFKTSFVYLGIIIGIQILLGIITLVMSKGQIPVLWGVLHQATAIFVLLSMLHCLFIYKYRKVSEGHMAV